VDKSRAHIGSKEREAVKIRFPEVLAFGERIQMRTNQIERVLSGKTKIAQITFTRKNVSQFGMVILNSAFLCGLHGIAEKYARTAGAVRAGFHTFRRRKLCSPIRQENAHIFVKKGSAQNRFQIVHPLDHIIRSFMIVVNSEKEGKGQELESLDKGSIAAVVVDSIHLNNGRIRIFSEKRAL
jgi:hypothetical protein